MTRKEGNDTVFAGFVDTELTEMLCDDLEIEMSLVRPVLLHYNDTCKRTDEEKWKAVEEVEIKNFLDNDTFETCELERRRSLMTPR